MPATAAAGARATVTRTAERSRRARDYFVDAPRGRSVVRPSCTFLLLLRPCTCARRDMGAETLVSGSAASRPPAHSASVRC